MKITHFLIHIKFQAMQLKSIAYTIATICMLILMTGISHAQLTSPNGWLYLGNQSLYANTYNGLYYRSNDSDVVQFVLRDKEGSVCGKLYGNADGEQFGLKDGDSHWSYFAKKDDYTEFRIDNTKIMKLFAGGEVAIGIASVPADYLVGIGGKIIAEEMRIKPSNFWDEVFETDYDLMSIEEKQEFTETNKHLPSFAPESEIVNEGMDVGKSFADVAKELEEAHLYIYQLNDRIKDLEKQRSDKDDLQKQLDELKVQLIKLSEQSDE